jgi:ribosomal protein S18 acetylase RimI-like enzyme
VSATIREYESRDLERCRGLWRELTQRHRDIYASSSIGGDNPGDRFDEYLGTENLAGPWVAVEGSDVVGMAGLLVSGIEAEIEPVIVQTQFRSRGIGTELIDRLKTEARVRGVEYLSIRPVARNVEAIACFHRAGFSLLGHLDMFVRLTDSGDRKWKHGIEIHGHAFRY